MSQGSTFFTRSFIKLKKPISFKEQVEKLKEKNIVVENHAECQEFLRHVNYYRFSAYYLPFKAPDGKCFENTTFRKLQMIYEFDQHLSSLIIDIIEDIEVYLRTQFAYYHSHTYGELGYMSPKTYNHRHDHISFIEHVNSCINENRNTLLVRHHMEKYDGKFPLWVIIEFFSIGMLSYFYRSFKTYDKKRIVHTIYKDINYQHLESWMRCITDLRNKCAHYSRLYYWIFPAIPKMPENIKYTPTRRLFAQLYMLKMMCPDVTMWEQKFMKPLRYLIKQYKPYISLQHLDFPYRWNSMLTK
ncbi:MAG: Abi family protein [Anaerovoracaceae bacterium]|nr:Abi family protein [Clostridiales bacterium]